MYLPPMPRYAQLRVGLNAGCVAILPCHQFPYLTCNLAPMEPLDTAQAGIAALLSWLPRLLFAGNHEEESEFVFGDDITRLTSCEYPGHAGGAAGDCARAFM